ncbi:MAG TPA: septal ring lytic transglycosylase RlpA family protein [Candidatus Binatia bacterium]|nr:septal ring lytic transglycosylase RlpA family protein [Candidatus Binatia bacterium]
MRMRWGWAAALLIVGGCSLFRGAPAPPPMVGGVQEGVASWYGPGFHGRRTANGEIFDQYELTAAHPSLPLGTRAVVTNLRNGRVVEVRINDRGPFVDGRVIDLSYAAARVLGMVGPGTARVRVEVLGAAPPRLAADAAPRPGRGRRPVLAPQPTARYVVQIAAFGDAGRAEHLRRVLESRFPDAHVRPLASGDDRYFRVLLGPYPMRGVAVARAELVGRMGYPAVIAEDAAP